MDIDHSNIRYTLAYADNSDRSAIYAMRHAIYAEELGQHKVNENGNLQDELDKHNVYLVLKRGINLLGFVSITCPGTPKFSVDKYFSRDLILCEFDETLFEVRLLSIQKEYRQSWIALALMYAAKRYVESHGGNNIVAICRQDLLNMYQRAGLEPTEHCAQSGDVRYILCTTDMAKLNRVVNGYSAALESIKKRVDWRFHFAFKNEQACYHGGAFFKAIGEDLKSLDRRGEIINADVLDAWFPPHPRITEAINRDLSWLLQTSPPTHNDGLIRVISKMRKVATACILPGSGSSDLIFLGLLNLLNSQSKVLLLDPAYGEYRHVLKEVIGCDVTPFELSKDDQFAINADRLREEVKMGYDLVVLINPNSPTGVYMDSEALKDIFKDMPLNTLAWIDETYIEFVGAGASLESFAADSENVIVCKSMSKVYALSGARAAYLCAPPHIVSRLFALTPPWSVSLPAQLAAIIALEHPDYYQQYYEETHRLRADLVYELTQMGFQSIIPGVANFILCYVPDNIEVRVFIEKCRRQGLYLRDVANMGNSIGKGAIRIAVKDSATNKRMVAIMQMAFEELNQFLLQPSCKN